MALTDYKIKQIVRVAGRRAVVVARIYEGDITTEDELNLENNLVPVTRYRRTGLLRQVMTTFAEGNPQSAILAGLNTELATDATRTPIDEQRVVLRL